MSKRGNETKYVVMQVLAACFLASTGIFVRFGVLPPVNTGLWRMIFALPVLFFMARRELKLLKWRDVLILLLSGAFFAGDQALFNLAFNCTSVANTNLLANLTAFTIVPASYFLFKEKLPKHFLLGALTAIAGLLLLVMGKAEPTQSNYLGDLMAFGASFFYAGYLLITYRLRDRFSGGLILFVSAIGAIVTLAVSAAAIEGLQAPTSFAALWPVLGITLLAQIVGHSLLSHCEGKLSVNLSCTICLLQPVIAALYSFLFFREKLSAMELLGVAVVIAGVYLVRRQYAPAKEPAET